MPHEDVICMINGPNSEAIIFLHFISALYNGSICVLKSIKDDLGARKASIFHLEGVYFVLVRLFAVHRYPFLLPS
jgi:hypothetical protein